eukprot:jgi/Mesen1/8309/ME000455S07466
MQYDVAVLNDAEVARGVTADPFVCATLDWWPPDKCNYGVCPWGRASLFNLVRELMLHVLACTLGGERVGSLASLRSACKHARVVNTSDVLGFSGGCLSMDRWHALNNLCVSFTQWSGPWNASNAVALMELSAARGYPVIAWELGNELGGAGGVAAHIAAAQYARDGWQLRAAVDRIYSGSLNPPLVVGGDTNLDPVWFRRVLRAAGRGTFDVISRHSYFLGPGSDPQLPQHILSPARLNSALQDFRDTVAIVREAVKPSPPPRLWMGESGGAYNSGQHLATDSFLYLDQLGMAAANEHSLHCHQSLVGGSYGLGGLALVLINLDRLCARHVSLLLSSSSSAAAIKQNVTPPGVRHEYHLTAPGGDLTSQTVLLNGAPLSLNKDGRVANLKPRECSGEAPIAMAPLSYAFVTFPEAGFSGLEAAPVALGSSFVFFVGSAEECTYNIVEWEQLFIISIQVCESLCI